MPSRRVTHGSLRGCCRAWQGDQDPTYKLLVACNGLVVDIENEIAAVHGFLKDKYRPRFPELESLIHNPVDYARTSE